MDICMYVGRLAGRYQSVHCHNGWSVGQWIRRPGFNPMWVHIKDSKNGTCLTLSIIRYWSKVSGAIQGKEWRPILLLDVVGIEKGAFGSPSSTVSQLIYIYIYIYIYRERGFVKLQNFLFYLNGHILFISSAFLQFSFNQGPVDREVILGSFPVRFRLYRLIVFWEIIFL